MLDCPGFTYLHAVPAGIAAELVGDLWQAVGGGTVKNCNRAVLHTQTTFAALFPMKADFSSWHGCTLFPLEYT